MTTATFTDKSKIQDAIRSGNKCRDAALYYLIELGWSVLPICCPDHANASASHAEHCGSPGKAPWSKWKEFQERLPTASEVLRWWSSNCQSNVGLALGPVSGLVRIDVDGPAGEAKLAELSGGDLPPTLEFTSGRENSGRGLLYAIPGGVSLKTTPIRTNAPKTELRFQAQGAQTVLPPSRHPSGTQYAWTPGHSPHEIGAAPMPSWLVEAMKADAEKDAAHARQFTPLATAGHSTSLDKRITAYLAKCAPAISGQGGHDTTFSVACTLVLGFGLSPADAYPYLADWNATCVPPWTEAELRHKLDGANQQAGERGRLLVDRAAWSSLRHAELVSEIGKITDMVDWGASLADLRKPARFDLSVLELSNIFSETSLIRLGEEINEEREKQKKTNEILREVYVQARKEAPACLHPMGVMLDHKRERKSMLHELRCNAPWSIAGCTGCRTMATNQWVNHFKQKFTLMRQAGAEEVYTLTCTDAEWKSSVKKRCYRGQKKDRSEFAGWLEVATDDDGESWTVISTYPIRGSTPITLDVAEKLVECLKNFHGHFKPVHASTSWQLPTEDRIGKESDWTRRGKISQENMARSDAVLAEFESRGVKVINTAVSPNASRRIQRSRVLVYPLIWNAEDTAHLYDSLAAGELLPRTDLPNDDDDGDDVFSTPFCPQNPYTYRSEERKSGTCHAHAPP